MEVNEPSEPPAPGVAASAPGDAAPVLNGESILPRRRATAYVVGAVLATVVGEVAYAVLAPDVPIVDIELQRGNGAGRLPAGTTKAVLVDFLFIVGYGSGLYLAMKLARAVFRSAGQL